MLEVPRNGAARNASSWRIARWSAAVLILLLPLIAMQFTEEVNWDLADFAVFGALLTSVGVSYDWVVRTTGDNVYRAAVGVALAGAFLLVWVNGAVGIMGSENNPANLMYGGVLAVGIIGAIIARLQPAGMTRALFATALAQGLVPVVALIAGLGSPQSEPLEVAALNGFFVALFVGSALLFKKAASARNIPRSSP